MALLARIPWLWQTVTAFGIGWLGGWPGEGDEETSSTSSVIMTVLWVALGAGVAIFAFRRLEKA